MRFNGISMGMNGSQPSRNGDGMWDLMEYLPSGCLTGCYGKWMKMAHRNRRYT